MANSVEPDQTAPGSTPFASILNSSVMLGNNLQQTTSADDIFRCIFSWRFKDLERMCKPIHFKLLQSIHYQMPKNITL